MYATQYLARIWPLGSSLCYANAVFRYINAFGDWVSVGIIAVSRCIFLLKPGFARRYLTIRNSYIICLMIWAYTSLIMIPLYTGVIIILILYENEVLKSLIYSTRFVKNKISLFLGYGYLWIQLCTRKVRLSSVTKVQNPTTNHILYNWVFCSLCNGDSELLSYMALRPGFLNKFDAPRVGHNLT